MPGHDGRQKQARGKIEQKARSNDEGTLASTPRPSHAGIQLEKQQALLNIFAAAFHHCFNDDSLPGLIQQIKQHLYARNFVQAFGTPELLEAYAVRWSPSRALAYLDLLSTLPEIGAAIAPSTHARTDEAGSHSHAPVKIVSLGAGAGAELVALAGLLSHWEPVTAVTGEAAEEEDALVKSTESQSTLGLTVIDIADWATVLSRLDSRLRSPTGPSGKPGPALLLAGQVDIAFTQADLLQMDVQELGVALLDTRLVTLFFTLNELYTASHSQTTVLLLGLSLLATPGTLLLVVDSPGSYSTVRLGSSSAASRRASTSGASTAGTSTAGASTAGASTAGASTAGASTAGASTAGASTAGASTAGTSTAGTSTADASTAGPSTTEAAAPQIGTDKTEDDEDLRRYPMQWLLDHTLLHASSIGSSKNAAGQAQWEKLYGEEARWFRVERSLRYPLALENMRYQVHLYRRLGE